MREKDKERGNDTAIEKEKRTDDEKEKDRELGKERYRQRKRENGCMSTKYGE